MRKVRVSLVFPEDLYLELKEVAEGNAESLSSLVTDILKNTCDGEYVALKRDILEELERYQDNKYEIFEFVNNVLRKYLDGCLVEIPYDKRLQENKGGGDNE